MVSGRNIQHGSYQISMERKITDYSLLRLFHTEADDPKTPQLKHSVCVAIEVCAKSCLPIAAALPFRLVQRRRLVSSTLVGWSLWNVGGSGRATSA